MTQMTRVACGLLLLNACAGAHMALPADVAQASEELPIKERSSWSGALVDESFVMGPYKVTDVDRKWDSTRSGSALGLNASSTHGGYAYKLADSTQHLVGQCATENNEKSAQLGGGVEFSSMHVKLACNCSDADGSANLLLQASTTETYEGELKTASGAYHVQAINEREGSMQTHDPAGYRVDGDGDALGAVDVMGTGRAWLSKTLQDRKRADVACIFAGLLLYKPPADR
jgi:hypothetical protein